LIGSSKPSGVISKAGFFSAGETSSAPCHPRQDRMRPARSLYKDCIKTAEFKKYGKSRYELGSFNFTPQLKAAIDEHMTGLRRAAAIIQNRIDQLHELPVNSAIATIVEIVMPKQTSTNMLSGFVR
jgi:hypothetical protein